MPRLPRDSDGGRREGRQQRFGKLVSLPESRGSARRENISASGKSSCLICCRVRRICFQSRTVIHRHSSKRRRGSARSHRRQFKTSVQEQLRQRRPEPRRRVPAASCLVLANSRTNYTRERTTSERPESSLFRLVFLALFRRRIQNHVAGPVRESAKNLSSAQPQ